MCGGFGDLETVLFSVPIGKSSVKTIWLEGAVGKGDLFSVFFLTTSLGLSITCLPLVSENDSRISIRSGDSAADTAQH